MELEFNHSVKKSVHLMLTKIELVAQTLTGGIHRKFKTEEDMQAWFYSIKGTSLENSYVPARITTTIEIL